MSSSDISIDGLTVVQKLNLMEQLWVELSRKPSDIPSPDWHGDVLSKRRQMVENGEIEFVDWSAAKKTLATTIRMKIRILPNAEKDLEIGADFYESQCDGLIAYFVSSLISDIESLKLYAGIHETY